MHLGRLTRLARQRGRFFISRNVSPIQIIVTYYILTTLVALALFYLPIFRQPGKHIPFIDMFFLSISTVSVTGLITVPIDEVFNQYGIILLELLFQVGGLGIMMISTFFFIVSRRKISLKQRQLIMTDMNQPRLSGIVRLIQTTFIIILVCQVLAGSFFTLYFKLANYFPTWKQATFHGFYEAISSVTNSGFDVTGNSLMPYANDYFFLMFVMVLIYIGGIGFPVLLDFRAWLFSKFRKKKRGIPFRFSLFTKIAFSASIVLFIGGAILIFLLEKDHLFKNMGLLGQTTNSMFYSLTTRSAGLQLHDLGDFQITTLIIFSILMFIGCSPSSVGGGVRTTTVVIIALYIWSFLKGERHVNIFGRRIADDDIRKSIVVLFLSFNMCMFCVLFLSATEDIPLIALIVEVTSAFGTTGLSLGITSDLTTVGKLIISLLMFVGRIGMLYMLMLFMPKMKRDAKYQYPVEKIIIG